MICLSSGELGSLCTRRTVESSRCRSVAQERRGLASTFALRAASRRILPKPRVPFLAHRPSGAGHRSSSGARDVCQRLCGRGVFDVKKVVHLGLITIRIPRDKEKSTTAASISARPASDPRRVSWTDTLPDRMVRIMRKVTPGHPRCKSWCAHCSEVGSGKWFAAKATVLSRRRLSKHRVYCACFEAQ